MSGAITLIAPQTATATVANADTNTQEADQVCVMTTGSGLATSETVTIGIINSDSGVTTYVSPYTNTVVQLTATLQSAMIPGGFNYSFTKSVTAGACGLDIALKPRIGGGQS